MNPSMNIVILGLSITSSWGNGHATTYRGLVRELVARGHNVLFLERDVPWYAENRDYNKTEAGETELYQSLDDLRERFTLAVREADLVIVGSYVPEGVAVGDWAQDTANGVVAFYDIDTPVTLAKLESGSREYLAPEQIPGYHLYLSFTGGPTLRRLEKQFGSPMARPLYCSVDPRLYFPERVELRWDLGYLGTYSADRQPTLEALLLEPARRLPESKFIVAGPQYPASIQWPGNVQRETHLAPREHRRFYNSQRYTLNVTRGDMVKAGWSPSVRLFEAAACGTPIISDYWDGLEDFFELDDEIFIARSAEQTTRFLKEIPEDERIELGERARLRILEKHTAAHRAAELESYAQELLHLTSLYPSNTEAGKL